MDDLEDVSDDEGSKKPPTSLLTKNHRNFNEADDHIC
jgi:hypothetical protein